MHAGVARRLDSRAVIACRGKSDAQLPSLLYKCKKAVLRGKELVFARHTLDNARALNLMGYKVDSPILHDYAWPGQYTPKKHQYATAEFLTLNKKCFVLNGIGTGKTISALWAADYMMDEGDVSKVLIVSPLSTLDEVWANEIFKHFPRRKYAVLHGSRAKRMSLLSDKTVDYYIINHDGFGVIAEELNNRPDINLVIVDECAVYRNYNTDRFKMFRDFIDQHPNLRLWMMSATPTPTAPTDAWSQCRLVNKNSVPKYFGQFKKQVMRQVSTYAWVPKHDAIEKVHQAMQPAIRFERSQCLDLPPTVYQNYQVDLTKEQTKLYNKMVKELSIDIDEGTVTAANEGVKLSKLIQIICGVVYDNTGGHRQVDASTRLNLLTNLIEQSGEKVIVFVPLRGALRKVADTVGKQWTVDVVHGNVSRSKRRKIFNDFQNRTDPHVLVAHPKCMSHGLTLTSATTIIWYAPYPSYEVYEQANGRISREGQTRTTNVVHLISADVERRMYGRLKNKERLQGLLLDAVRDTTGGKV